MKLMITKKTVSVLLIFCVVLCIARIFVIFKSFSNFTENSDNLSEKRKYNIVVTGSSENQSFVRQLYEGAENISSVYECAIEYYVPDSKNTGTTLQSLFDYASFIDADGVIVYTGSFTGDYELPHHRNGNLIPMVTIGTYNPDIPQISYIGVNYSGLGKILGNELIAMSGIDEKICILNTKGYADTNYSTLISSLFYTISDYYEKDNVKILTIQQSSSLSKEDSIRQELASLGNVDVIVSLSEESTIMTVQALTDLNRSGKTRLLGFGDGDESRFYFDKGLIDKLILINPVGMGSRAVTELYEYLNNGYANNYITSDIEILRRGSFE